MLRQIMYKLLGPGLILFGVRNDNKAVADVSCEIKTGSYKDLFNPACLIYGIEDAASNYARAFFNLGKVYIDSFMNVVRKMANHCDHIALFEIINSYSGGTGSGLTSLLLERLSEDFSKTFRFETGIFPSATLSESTVGPYNSLLYTHSTFENLDCGVLVDNESIYKKLCQQLECQKPTFSVINRFLAQMLSCLFLSHRYSYQGSQHMDFDELMTNAVPYPRIHFPVLAYAPIVNANQMNHEINKPIELIRQIFQTNSHFLNCPMQMTKYISCCLLFRGLVCPKDVYDAVAVVKSDYRIQFVDWCPTGFKIGINNQPSLSTPNHALAASNQTLCTLSGNVGIKEAWCGLRRKYEMLVSKKAFIHWYVGEGLEENDFHEANEDIQVLENDYEEISKDSGASPEVEIQTINPTKKKFSSKNTNNNLLNKDSSSTMTKNTNTPQNASPSNCHTCSYSRTLYDDIVSRLDTKLNCSNNKMVKKLNKLHSRLNFLNKTYVDNRRSEKDSKCSDSDECRSKEDLYNTSDREFIERNVVVIKKLIRRQTMDNLAFSSKEHIICAPRNDTRSYSGTETISDTDDIADHRSMTTRVTSVASAFI